MLMQSAWDVLRQSSPVLYIAEPTYDAIRMGRAEDKYAAHNSEPVDKSKISAETRSVPVRIVNLEIEKDDICHPLKA